MSDTAICLSTSEIVDITGKQRSSAQIRELRAMGIDAKQRSDGTVVVFRASILPINKVSNKKPAEPDYSAL